MKSHMIIPLFVPHNGCPHECIFCNQKKIAGTVSSFDEVRVREQIEDYLSSAESIPHIEIAFFGGSFTGIPMNEQKAYLKLATEYVHRYDLDGIRLSTRPDMISTDILEHLSHYPVIAIELGVQSMVQEVLDASYRGHTVQDVYKASQLIRHYEFKLGLQMMLGLPKDSINRSLLTANRLIAIEPDMVRIYPTLVVKETALAILYEEGLYEPFDLDTTIELCVALVERFVQAGIDVLRIGLQTTDQIQLGKDVIAGPHHPALGQLVDERRWVKFILDYVKAFKEGIIIEANQKLYQILVGHKRVHLSIWANHEPIIEIKYSAEVPDGVLKINDEMIRRFEQRL